MKPKKSLDVEEIKLMRETKTVEQIADHFGVSKSLIEKRLQGTKKSTVAKSVNTDIGKVSPMGLLGNPGAIDPNTALFFLNKENNQLLAEKERYKAERNQAKNKIEEQKEKIAMLERQLDDSRKELNGKPHPLAGLTDGLAEGFKANPAETIKAIGELFQQFKGGNSPQSAAQIGAIDTSQLTPEAGQFLAAITNMLNHEAVHNPPRFFDLCTALVALTKPEQQAILQQLKAIQ